MFERLSPQSNETNGHFIKYLYQQCCEQITAQSADIFKTGETCALVSRSFSNTTPWLLKMDFRSESKNTYSSVHHSSTVVMEDIDN